jgi:leucyl-tRNA synthetase
MYDYKEIEKKWQTYWKENKTFKAEEDSNKKKYYYLVEFPYPSGSGLHVGHVRSYAALDAMARKKRMQGYNVLYPIGWDAFGLPAEQYAIANKIHPSKAVEENIATFKGQIERLGISFDFNREFSTTDPEYYKWTQWQFLKFFEKGMAYKEEKNINWCPSCKIGLSNEESSGGVCERCGSAVVQKPKSQWILKMSDYAEDLLTGLEDTQFSEKIKIAQENWIGKSIGANIDFVTTYSDYKLKVFTTRPDTIYGANFLVIAPEHELVELAKEKISNLDELIKYKEEAARKSEFERTEIVKDKTGIKIEGISAINPLTNEQIPIFIADYVMTNYGTGAIMAVPAHDERDFEFANTHNLEIIRVIEGGELPYTGDGIMVNSGFLNGISNKEAAISKMIDYLVKNNLGERKINYRLQDWIFSRQRFWGEPIPLVYCEKCGWVAVPYEDLPVRLPDVAEYEPTDDGESPLAKIPEFYETTCPKCGLPARRETDTMPNWAGSSWYFLRYMDPHNNKEFASRENLNYWGKVDFYNGGMEHATRHLLYARFWNQFLYNEGLVPEKEPFDIRVAHGMILGEGGVKMSKSLGNVVNPDDAAREFGVDALRVYEMFIGDYEKEVVWSTNGLNGCRRFLDKVIRLKDKVKDIDIQNEKEMHKTIQKVTNDIDNLKFNTAISAIMIYLKDLENNEYVSAKEYRVLLHLLNPFAPHITEELNQVLNLGKPLCESAWPTYDETKMQEDVYEMIVQVNGKVRARTKVNVGTSKEKMEEIAKSQDNVIKHLENKEIIRVIIVPDKLVNIVVK